MRKIACIAWVALCMLSSCSEKEHAKSVAPEPSVKGSEPGDASEGQHAKETSSPRHAAVKPVTMRALLGPFASIAAYCESRPAGAKPGSDDLCRDELVAALEGPQLIINVLSPYRSVRFFREGASDPESSDGERCSLGIEVATGWFVLPSLFDCQPGNSERGKVLELAVGGSANGRYVRLLYRSAPPATSAALETSGNRDSLLLCGPVEKGKIECLPPIVVRSSVVETSKTDSKVEKFLLDVDLSEGRVATRLKMGTLPDSQALVSYALPFVVPATLDGLALYRKHLKAGRQLSKQGKYADAIAALKAALEASDGRQAQSELGYAAYRAGDLETASEASLRAAESPDPRVAAASLYNLGLAQEGLHKKTRAIGSYARSLALRPNQTVWDRRRELAGDDMEWNTWIESPKLLLEEQEVIALYEGDEEEEEEDDQYPVVTSAEIVDQGDYAIVKVRSEDGHGFGDSRFHLAKKVGSKYLLLATVGDSEYGLEPQSMEVYLGFTIAVSKFETEQVGERKVTRLEYTKTMKSDGEDSTLVSTKENRVVFCVAEGGAQKCTDSLPLGMDWSATLSDSASQLDKEIFAQDYESPSPASWSYRLQAERAEGVVTLKAVRGLRTFQASYHLWP